MAKRLDACAKALRDVAGDMAAAGVKSVLVLHSRGVRTALRDTVEPFAVDARKKADRKL